MSAPVLETAAVTKRFSGLTAVDAVSLTVEAGEIRGVVGPNGAGKTTLFNLVSGLSPVTAGRVRLGGADVTGQSAHARAAAGLGRTYQTPLVFADLDLFDNVAVAFAARRHPSAREAIFGRARHRRAAVDEVRALLDFAHLPADLARPAGALSFAEQKRLEIARALAGQPRLLLLDEPAAGLNRTEIDALMRLIRRLHERGITICLIEHNMRLVMGLCDRITVLDFGRVIAEGAPAAVRSDPRVIAAYLGTARHAAV